MAKSVKCVKWLVDVELVHLCDIVEVVEWKLAEASIAVHPDEPHEEFIDDDGVFCEVFFKIEYLAVVEGGHHAYIMKRGCIALEVLYGVGVGVDGIGIGEHLL